MAFETIRVYRDGVLVGSTIADAVGGFSLNLDTTAWSIGDHVVEVEAEDPARPVSQRFSRVVTVSAQPTFLWRDLFDRADGPPGNGWQTQDAAVAAIVSGDLVRTDAGNYRLLWNVATGTLPADYRVTMTIAHSLVISQFWGLAGRFSGGAGVEVFWTNAGNGTARAPTRAGNLAFQNDAVITVTGGLPASWALNQDHTVGLDFRGQTVAIILDGQEYGTFTMATNWNVAGTGIGVTGDALGSNSYVVRDITVDP